jgi:Co-chaperonin GroES (HSP10)
VLKPLGDRVVLKAETEEEKTVGGIVLASNVKEKPTTGKVIAVGEGRTLDNGKSLLQLLRKATGYCLTSTPAMKLNTTGKVPGCSRKGLSRSSRLVVES